MVFHCLLMVAYLVSVKPFEEPMLNRIEIMNEVTVLVASIHLFAFSDFVEDPQRQYLMGWSLISFTCLNIGINFLIMLGTMLSDAKLLLKKLIPRLTNFLKSHQRAKIYETYATPPEPVIVTMNPIALPIPSSNLLIPTRSRDGGFSQAQLLHDLSQLSVDLNRNEGEVVVDDNEIRRTQPPNLDEEEKVRDEESG
jgi:hypothetical protein